VDLIPVYRTTHLTEAAVMKSKLEADGLHPFVKNYEHAQMSQIDILALGGMTIMVPENEAERAHEILTDQSEEFIEHCAHNVALGRSIADYHIYAAGRVEPYTHRDGPVPLSRPEKGNRDSIKKTRIVHVHRRPLRQ